jgi:hypothetical protein
MTKRLESVLSRVLSTEIGTQLAWREQDMKNDLPYEDRNAVIEELKQFMDVRGIDLNYDYVIKGKEQARG